MNQSYLVIEEFQEESVKGLDHNITAPEEQCHHAYFEALEQACGELENIQILFRKYSHTRATNNNLYNQTS